MLFVAMMVLCGELSLLIVARSRTFCDAGNYGPCARTPPSRILDLSWGNPDTFTALILDVHSRLESDQDYSSKCGDYRRSQNSLLRRLLGDVTWWTSRARLFLLWG